MAIDAKIEDDQAEADRYRRQAAEVSEQVERINGAIERTRRQIDLDLEKGQHKVADLRIPAVVAGALQSVDGSAPAQLGEACQRIIRDFALDPSDREGFAEWSASIAIPLTSGEHANLTIHGTVTNRKDGAWRNRRGRKRGLAGLRFEQHLSLDDVARTANIGRHRAVSDLRKELSSIIDSPGLRSAAIDCPVEETQHEISNLLSGDAPGSPFAEHIRDTYQADTKWPHCWAVDHHKTSRLVINLILDQPDPSQGVDIAAASLALDITPKELRRLANPKNRKRPPTLRQEKNKLFLFQCPHEDCPLPPSRRFVTHALITPETNASGLICSGCQRLPYEAYAGIRFPAAYLELWAGPLGTGGSAPSLSTEDATVLGQAPDYRPAMRAAAKPTLRTIGEAASLLGVSESSLRRWTKQGLVSCTWVVAKGGEQRMFSDKDLRGIDPDGIVAQAKIRR